MSRAVWPGRPFPLGPTWDGHGTNFSLFSENADGVELCLFDDEGREERIDVAQRTSHNWHVYLPGVGPGQRYGYRVSGPWEPTAGHRFNPAKLLIDPYAKAIEGPIGFGRARVLAYAAGRRGRAGRRGLGACDPALGRDRRLVRLGGGRASAAPLGRDGDLRAARQGVHAAHARRARRPARHVCGPRVRSRDRAPARPRRHRGRAPPRPPHCGRGRPRRTRALELLGLLDDRLPRAARGLCRHGYARRAGARVQGNGEGTPSRRHRGDPRRGLQPHRRRKPPRPDAVVQGRRQRLVLPPPARRPPALRGLHRDRQLAQPDAPVGAPADHGLAALLRDGVPRRRFPLRPRLGAGARVLRRRPPLRLLRHHPPGSRSSAR